MSNDAKGGGARHTNPSEGFSLGTIIGIVVAVLLILYLLWWLPARVASGYVMPQIEGSVATLPTRLPVIWIRAWPWQSMPPAAKVTFDLSGGRTVGVAATATAATSFYVRAVPATLSLSAVPDIPPAEISEIEVSWPGGSSSAAESALWVTAHPGEGQLPGAKVVWSTRMSAGARPGVALQIGANPDVLSLSSPDPVLSPWVNARCLPLASTADAAATESQLLSGKLPAAPVACNKVTTANAIAVAPPLPQSDSFFVWQPVVQELVNKHLRKYVVGVPLIASEEPLTSSSWWRFAASSLSPGF